MIFPTADKKYKKYLLVFILLFVTIILVGASPKGTNNTKKRSEDCFFSDIEKINIWVSIGTRVVGAIVGMSGLFLGYHYYKSRLKFDASEKTNEQKRFVLNLILNQLNTYDEAVDQILSSNFKSSDELRLLRHKVDRNFELIEDYLEINDTLIGFSEEEIKKIFEINSFVDKNELIMREKFKSLDRAKLQPQKHLYIELINKAKATIVNKIC